MNTGTKLKAVKQAVADKMGGDLNIDCIQLSIEGGEALKKNTNTLESYGIKDGTILVFEQIEKPPAVLREKKPKDSAKLIVHYRVLGSED